MTQRANSPATTGPARAGLVAMIVGIQAIAAIFFIADAIGDLAAGEMDFHILVEALIAFALLAGVGIGIEHRLEQTPLRQRRQQVEHQADHHDGGQRTLPVAEQVAPEPGHQALGVDRWRARRDRGEGIRHVSAL